MQIANICTIAESSIGQPWIGWPHRLIEVNKVSKLLSKTNTWDREVKQANRKELWTLSCGVQKGLQTEIVLMEVTTQEVTHEELCEEHRGAFRKRAGRRKVPEEVHRVQRLWKRQKADKFCSGNSSCSKSWKEKDWRAKKDRQKERRPRRENHPLNFEC